MSYPLNELRLKLKRRKLDAILVTQPENRRYLSGYTAADTSIAESAGILLIPLSGGPFLLTDSRYQLHAEAEARGYTVVLYDRGLFVLLQEMLPALGIGRLGFESHYFLYSSFLKLREIGKKLNIHPVPVSGLIEGMRARKDEEEILKIRESVALNEKVFREVYAGLRAGETERQVALKIETAMTAMGAEGPAFETIVAAGPNGALPHAVPADRPIREGEPLVIDMGLKLKGYCSDMTRTIVLGRPDKRTIELFRIVRRAQLAAMRLISDGVTARDVDRAARQVIRNAGFGGHFGHGLGHGVGLAVHEAPALNRRSRKKLRTGMVVTVEPGIYLPDWGGVRLENMVVVRDDGYWNLNEDTTFLDL